MSKKRILVVDDEPIATRTLVRFLERTGDYEVRAVNDPRRAIAEAMEFRPDLVISDILMPGMDGGELIAALRAEPELASVPAILLTGMVSEADLGQAAHRGGTPILAKPARSETLLALVEKQLAAGASDDGSDGSGPA